MAAVGDPLITPTVSVTYRSVANAPQDEEIGIHGNINSGGGDSVNIPGSTRRQLKPRLILGKAWGRSVKWLKARKKGEQAYRLVDREGHYHQSIGEWNIRRLKTQADVQKLIGLDPFHSFLNQSTLKIILLIIALYLSLVLLFAVVYTTISLTLGCNLQLTSIREGFLFSLETMTTVGYGTHDYLFGSCWIMLPMLSLQACIGLLIDAFLIGILFARLSRPQTRANTVVFTKNAVIRRVRGEAYFMFQVGELRKHQLLETRVRCYALRHERLTYNPCGNSYNNTGSTEASGFGARSTSVSSNIGLSGLGVSSSASGSTTTTTSAAELAARMPDQVFFQSHSMRLQHPDDELGGNLLLVLPQASTATVVHRIDAWSPMMPPPRWNSSHGPVQWGLHTDKDIVKAPWEEPPSSPEHKSERSRSDCAAATAASTAAAAAATAAAAAEAEAAAAAADDVGDEVDPASGMLRKQASSSSFSTDYQNLEQEELGSRLGNQGGRRQSAVYWEDASASEFGFNVNGRGTDDDTDNLGYVHRFPDLLKRWDDVDGDRGTWYEKMKRRLLRVEMERRRSEDMRRERERTGKTADDIRAASSRSRLAHAGFRRPPERMASIMRVGGGGVGEDCADDFAADRSKEAPALGRLSEGRQAPQGGLETPIGSPPVLSGSGDAPAGNGGGRARLNAGQWFAREERKAIDAYIQDRELEVVVILEGTDTSTGSTVQQARHSYCWEDILWDRTFACCVTRGEDGACEVDFSKFHDTLRAPANCDDHGFIQSYA
ncbi:unnamed protein product [Ectocarpus sp. 8 AP-2014]